MLKIIEDINGLFWGNILIVLLVGTGIFFTLKLNRAVFIITFHVLLLNIYKHLITMFYHGTLY